MKSQRAVRSTWLPSDQPKIILIMCQAQVGWSRQLKEGGVTTYFLFPTWSPEDRVVRTGVRDREGSWNVRTMKWLPLPAGKLSLSLKWTIVSCSFPLFFAFFLLAFLACVFWCCAFGSFSCPFPSYTLALPFALFCACKINLYLRVFFSFFYLNFMARKSGD